ncbi:hypothetical protein JL09_g6160 [Pichia kudriavzevii]|uniref:Uncharacterized protein n=1 Tax=Pichia kudriavzevii TaxID=4909 RepID=A0A099NS11_PICKU|nr:hypothetical protein JL09_g6160 [Pichia kudriavzevii]
MTVSTFNNLPMELEN